MLKEDKKFIDNLGLNQQLCYIRNGWDINHIKSHLKNR